MIVLNYHAMMGASGGAASEKPQPLAAAKGRCVSGLLAVQVSCYSPDYLDSGGGRLTPRRSLKTE